MEINVATGILGLILLIFWIWVAFLTARNGRWLLFVLGFFCGGIAWIIGAILGPKPGYGPNRQPY